MTDGLTPVLGKFAFGLSGIIFHLTAAARVKLRLLANIVLMFASSLYML